MQSFAHHYYNHADDRAHVKGSDCDLQHRVRSPLRRSRLQQIDEHESRLHICAMRAPWEARHTAVIEEGHTPRVYFGDISLKLRADSDR